MTFTGLIIATIVLPGAWGWLIGTSAARWWPVNQQVGARPPKTAVRRLTDYDI